MDDNLPWGLRQTCIKKKNLHVSSMIKLLHLESYKLNKYTPPVRARDVVGIIAHLVLPVASRDLIDFSSHAVQLNSPSPFLENPMSLVS